MRMCMISRTDLSRALNGGVNLKDLLGKVQAVAPLVCVIPDTLLALRCCEGAIHLVIPVNEAVNKIGDLTLSWPGLTRPSGNILKMRCFSWMAASSAATRADFSASARFFTRPDAGIHRRLHSFQGFRSRMWHGNHNCRSLLVPAKQPQRQVVKPLGKFLACLRTFIAGCCRHPASQVGETPWQ
jgi:hypothetical protein